MKGEEYPSFGYMLKNGATTFWESWIGDGSHDHPMYGYMVERDCNTLWEKILHIPENMRFTLSDDNKCTSFNHHFWGDVSAWYYTEVCGIHYNPYFDGKTDVKIVPKFVKGLERAEAFTHFSDREYGEWFGYLRRDGKPTEPPCKGHTYKGPFHVMRMLSKCIKVMEESE